MMERLLLSLGLSIKLKYCHDKIFQIYFFLAVLQSFVANDYLLHRQQDFRLLEKIKLKGKQ